MVFVHIECFKNVSFIVILCTKPLNLILKPKVRIFLTLCISLYPESEFSPWYVKSPIENITALCGTLQFRYSHDKRLLLDSEKGKNLSRYSNLCIKVCLVKSFTCQKKNEMKCLCLFQQLKEMPSHYFQILVRSVKEGLG